MIESVNHLSDLKWQSLYLELKLCLDFSRGIERQKECYQGTNITLIFTRPVDLFPIFKTKDTER